MNEKQKRAIEFAKNAYGEIRRKGDGTLLLLHGMEAMEIAETLTSDPDVLIATMLHDVVEDTDTTMDAILEEFGERVVELISADTENKRRDLPPSESWILRKQDTIDFLKATKDTDAKILVLGDKLSNIRSFAKLKRDEGDDMWLHFNQKDPEKHHWYYREIASCLTCFATTEAFKEYDNLIKYVFDEE